MKAPLAMEAALQHLPDGGCVVAVSGGLDSISLLHALRFGVGRTDLWAAHLDHGMHPAGGATRSWVAGICRAWQIPLHAARLESAPASEAQARDARYRFLERVRSETGAECIVTAHHADDQAETVLFRILRGTGVRGLSAMSPVRGRIHRPLLGLRRAALREYAAAAGVSWREDPTNQEVRLARNRIRLETLPALNQGMGGEGTHRLLQLSDASHRVLSRADRLDDALLGALSREVGPGRLELPLQGMERVGPDAAIRVLRHAARRLGGHLSRGGTRIAAEALGRMQAGQGVDLTGGFRLERGLDAWILLSPRAAEPRRRDFRGASAEDPEPRALCIDPGVSPSGAMELPLGGQGWRVAWRPSPWVGVPQATLARDSHLPVNVRGWRPGDRLRLSYGTKSVAKLLAEAGVSALDRSTTPVFEGEGGHILWVPGVSPGPAARGPEDDSLYFTCTRIPA